MRQIITSKEVLDSEAPIESTASTEAESTDKLPEELIKVHTVKSSSLLKFLLCESAKKAAAAVSRLASPFTQASPPKSGQPAETNSDLIVWDESKNGSLIAAPTPVKVSATPAKKIELESETKEVEMAAPLKEIQPETMIVEEAQVEQVDTKSVVSTPARVMMTPLGMF